MGATIRENDAEAEGVLTNQAKALARHATNTKATPPPRGVGCRWELRLLGWSSSRRRKLGIRIHRSPPHEAAERTIARNADSTIRPKAETERTLLELGTGVRM